MLKIEYAVANGEAVNVDLIDITIHALRNIRAVALGEPWGPVAELQRAIDVPSDGVSAPTPPAYPSLFPAPAAPSAAPAATADAVPVPGTVDSQGVPWDARIHSSNKKTTDKGVWQRRRNIPDATFAQITAELLARGPAVTPAAPAVAMTAVEASQHVEFPLPAATTPTPPAPPAIPQTPTVPALLPPGSPAPTPALPPFAQAMTRISGNPARFTPELINHWARELGMKDIGSFAHPQNIEALNTFISWMDQTDAAAAQG